MVEPVDGTGFSAYTSGGDVKHTTIVLNDVQGEFVKMKQLLHLQTLEQEQYSLIQ